MTKYGMLIDLQRCVACTACVAACSAYHSTPKGVLWNTMVYSERGTFPTVTRVMMPKACQQCENTPCVKVCPTGASYKRSDGIVLVDYNKCIGCRYCIEACPYDARTYVESPEPYFVSGFTPFEQSSPNHVSGIVQKCTFCVERIEAGTKAGLKPGVDRDATPVCINTCVAGARIFGDLDDPKSAISQLVANRKATQLLPQIGTNPKVFYIQSSKSVNVQGVLAH